jgi:hypothetical protein
MKKALLAVFGTLAVVLLCYLVWSFAFGGGIKGVANALITPINTAYQSVTGTSSDLITPWTSTSSTLSDAKI